jgi:hypothetical protein
LLLIDGTRRDTDLLALLASSGADLQAFAALRDRNLIREVPQQLAASAPRLGADNDTSSTFPSAAMPQAKPAPRTSAFAKLGQGLRAALESHADSPREVSAGLAEIIKCAAVADAELFAWLERHVDELRAQQQPAVAHAVQRIQQIRDRIETEDRQQRRSPSPLDFGLALGHVVESILGYGRYLHGEAIGLGMLMATDVAQALGLQNAASAERLRRLLQSAGLPMAPPRAPTARWLELLPMDGEVGNEHMRCVLLRDLSVPLSQAVPREQVLQVLEHAGALAT